MKNLTSTKITRFFVNRVRVQTSYTSTYTNTNGMHDAKLTRRVTKIVDTIQCHACADLYM